MFVRRSTMAKKVQEILSHWREQQKVTEKFMEQNILLRKELHEMKKAMEEGVLTMRTAGKQIIGLKMSLEAYEKQGTEKGIGPSAKQKRIHELEREVAQLKANGKN